MKYILTLFTAIAAILIFSSYDNASNKNVDLLGLADKDFKYIFKFDDSTSAEEIANAEHFLKQYDSSINIKHSINQSNGKATVKITSSNAKCEAANFGFGLIAIDKNNECRCAIGEKGK